MGKKKILIIDDDEGYVALERLRLEASGFEVISSTDEHEGIRMAVEDKPDVIILDILMPVMNGYRICHHLRSVEKLDTPIIMITGMGQNDDIEQAKNLGADDYIIKPYESKELIEKVTKLVSKK